MPSRDPSLKLRRGAQGMPPSSPRPKGGHDYTIRSPALPSVHSGSRTRAAPRCDHLRSVPGAQRPTLRFGRQDGLHVGDRPDDQASLDRRSGRRARRVGQRASAGQRCDHRAKRLDADQTRQLCARLRGIDAGPVLQGRGRFRAYALRVVAQLGGLGDRRDPRLCERRPANADRLAQRSFHSRDYVPDCAVGDDDRSG